METGKSKLKVSSWGSREWKKRFPANRPFPSFKNSPFQNEAKCKLVKMSLICMRIKNHFHTKAFALTQALNQRQLGHSWENGVFVTLETRRRLGRVNYIEKTSGTVTEDRGKNWPLADRHVHSNNPRNTCGRISVCSSFLLVSKLANSERGKKTVPVRGN